MKSIFFLLLTYATLALSAQTADELALTAYLNNEAASWEKALAAAEKLTDPEQRYLQLAEYHQLAGYASIGAEDTKSADRHTDGMEAALDAYWELNDKNAAAHGLYSAYLGMKIARKPMSGMIYGSRASKYARQALELGPDDPIALYNAAGNFFYTPEQWGGDRERALLLLERAAQTYGPADKENFRYLQTLALLGQVQASLGKTEAARATYQLALAAQPDFGYVRYRLLPQLDKTGK